MYLALELVSSSSSVEVNCLLSSSELLPAELLEESTLRVLPSALELSPLEKSDEERTCICGQENVESSAAAPISSSRGKSPQARRQNQYQILRDFLLQTISADSLTSTSWITSRKVTGLPQASTATFIGAAAEAAVSVAPLSPSAATITLVEGRRHFPPRI